MPISFDITPPSVAAVPVLGDKLPLDFEIRVPGGTVVSMPSALGPTTDCKMLVDFMLPSVTLSMAPFGMLFCLLDVLEKVKATLDAMPAALGPPPDPAEITTALSDLASAFGCITSAIPTLSVPLLVKDLLDYLIAMLGCMISSLQSIISNITALNDTVTSAASLTNPTLDAAILAARNNHGAAANQSVALLNPLQPVFTVMNLMFALIPGGHVIEFEQPDPLADPVDLTELNAMVVTLQGLEAQLTAIRGLIP